MLTAYCRAGLLAHAWMLSQIHLNFKKRPPFPCAWLIHSESCKWSLEWLWRMCMVVASMLSDHRSDKSGWCSKGGGSRVRVKRDQIGTSRKSAKCFIILCPYGLPASLCLKGGRDLGNRHWLYRCVKCQYTVPQLGRSWGIGPKDNTDLILGYKTHLRIWEGLLMLSPKNQNYTSYFLYNFKGDVFTFQHYLN